jgi:hypothetical protein
VNELLVPRKETLDEARRDLSKLEFDYRGYPTIPLAVRDGKKLDRLRALAVKFNIDPGEGGILIQEGYMLDSDLFELKVQVEIK